MNDINVTAISQIPGSMSLMSLIASADTVSKIVMLLLFASSIWSWTIICNKYLRYRYVTKKMAVFENTFWSGQLLENLYEHVRRSVNDPLSAIFVAAMNELKRQDNKKIDISDSVLKIGLKDRIAQSMHLIRNREIETLEKSLGVLATIGSTAPFIGLFGMVWGVMHSFQSIAASKNVSLAVVAPGIAESLLVTAIGLFAAIPAVIFYNLLTVKVENVISQMEDFIIELHSVLARGIDEEKI